VRRAPSHHPKSGVGAARSVAGALLIAVGVAGLGILVAAVLLMAGVGFLFCDKPGATPTDCLSGGAWVGFIFVGPFALPVAIGGLVAGIVLLMRTGPSRPEAGP
jgi:hypothetical protein